MINQRDVIRMLIPYPNISSKLAVQSHMYICKNRNVYEFVKCQRFKPYMITSKSIKHFVDEDPDATRNPFIFKTRIDCDKIFTIDGVIIDSSLKTQRGITGELFANILSELECEGYLKVSLDKNDIVALNHRITLKP